MQRPPWQVKPIQIINDLENLKKEEIYTIIEEKNHSGPLNLSSPMAPKHRIQLEADSWLETQQQNINSLAFKQNNRSKKVSENNF